MELRFGLRLLREWWKVIVAVTLLATATGAFLTWRETPLYASQVTLFVSASGSSVDTESAYHANLLSQQKASSYTELLRGQQVMSGVVDRLGLDLTLSDMSEKVSSAMIPGTSLFTATVQDSVPWRAQQIADAVGQKFVELVPTLEGIAEGQQPTVKVTIVSPAELPSSPETPQPVRNVTLAALLGLSVGFGLVAAGRALDNTVKTPEQAEEFSESPSLATVPFDPTAAESPLSNPALYTPRAEAFWKLQTNLQFANLDRPHKVILVTSAAPDEGKSSTACNLSIALAETGKRVILVDGDLRRPGVARYLGLPNGVGLTSVLLGDISLAEATQSEDGQPLAVVTSGPVPPNPTALLASPRLRSVLQSLAAAYDVVIVDSSAVLPVADAAVLAASCDGAAVVVRHGKTRHEQLRGAVRALRNVGVPILGTVLNRVPSHWDKTYYSNQPAIPVHTPRHQERPAGAQVLAN